jgi:hypothetical protein
MRALWLIQLIQKYNSQYIRNEHSAEIVVELGTMREWVYLPCIYKIKGIFPGGLLIGVNFFTPKLIKIRWTSPFLGSFEAPEIEVWL